MRRIAYDQRVSTLIEVRGGEREWAEAERCFEEHGWPVAGHHPRGEGPLRGVLDPDPASRVYEVEVRLFGAARGCDRGAAQRVRKAVRAARLEAYVLRAEPLVRDREMLPEWRAYSTRHRHSGPHGRWWRRAARYVVRAGRYDTGVRVTGTPRQALRLARTNATASATAGDTDSPSRVAVRPLDGRWRGNVRFWPEEEGERRLLRVFAGIIPATAAAVFASGHTGFAWWFWGVVAVVAGCAGVWAGTGLYREGRTAGVLVALVALCVFLSMGLGLLSGDGTGWTRTQILVTGVIVAVLGGLRLLVRQWTWGEWVAWAVPLAATLAASSFLAAGSLLHTLYADALSFSPDDLDVPAVWQTIAAVKLLTLLSLVMVVPAWWGYARHRHHFYAAPGEGFNIAMYVLLMLALLGGSALLALNSAEVAADKTKAAAIRGEDPPSYFGVEPEWTCVEPAVPVGRLSGEGPRLVPKRPYLSFGIAQGTAVLWDRVAKKPVKLRASQVRLVPAKSAMAVCGGAAS
ncbi:hypothetical protein [Streptomyces iranensis]|uniref:hypothetical protein n=1 Tax=Streptomyces iranensis TaxID=576784 RepID=UPI0039B73BF6